MSNSSLVSYTQLSPNHSGKRKYPLTRITIHCIVGQASMKTLCNIFANPSCQASSNYGVCTDGICLIVNEDNRSWCSSNSDNDNRAITIEVASDTKHPYSVRDDVYERLIKLVYDICKRNGKNKLIWFGDKDKTLAYKPADNEMVLTVHRWFANKSCPGEYLYNRHSDIVERVNKMLSEECDMCKYYKNGKCEKGIDLTEKVEKIEKGDIVKIIGNKYYSGTTIPQWVKNKKWVVYSAPAGSDRIVLNESTDGENEIMSPVHIKDLKLLKKG